MKNSVPPLLLAYVGDAVYELYIRRKLVLKEVLPIQQTHRKAVRLSRAAGQDRVLRTIEPVLTPDEAEIVRRGRNTKSRVPKSADMAEYRRATGLEALLGWLYLNGDHGRISELLDMIEFGEEE